MLLSCRPLRISGSGFGTGKVQGFRILGVGIIGFWDQGLGFLGFRVSDVGRQRVLGSGFMVSGF